MIKLDAVKNMSAEEKYEYMLLLLKGQLSIEQDAIANLSNASAIIYGTMDRINWAGFYLLRGDTLILGPFQGLPACNRIEVGEGVCGTAVNEKKLQRVKDVHEFPGHIACDSASNSELVIPIINGDNVYGVLDIDSPEFDRFSDVEERWMIKVAELLRDRINWQSI